MKHNFRTIASAVFFVCGIVIIIVTLVLVTKERKRAHAIENVIRDLEQQKEKYEHENMELQDRIAYLQSEHSYEKEAKKLNYKKPGEHAVIIRRSPTQKEDIEDPDTAPVTTQNQQLPHYRIWLNYFF